MDAYEKLLEEAHGKVTVNECSSERFEMPKVEGHHEGKKTILTNFCDVAAVFRRECEHLQKFLLKELATSGQQEGDRLVLNNKVPSTKINQKLEQYAKEFVICKECCKPDTELIKQDGITHVHCLACGAKHPVRSKI